MRSGLPSDATDRGDIQGVRSLKHHSGKACVSVPPTV